MRIGYLTDANPEDKLPWSGTIHNIYRGMQNAGIDVVWIPVKLNFWIRFIIKFGNRLLSMLYGNGDMYHTKLISFLCGKTIDRKLLNEVDVVFSPAGSVYLAFLKTNKPIVYCTDATFHLLENYYDYLKNLPAWNKKQGDWIEYNALRNSTYVFPASDWAAASMENDYKVAKEKIYVAELGANLQPEVFKQLPAKEYDGIDILFCGVDWNRKGGSIACDTCIELNNRGIKARLHIVGVRSLPPVYQGVDSIDLIGFLNKNNPAEYERLLTLYREADIFLLPTQAECAGIVFAEASAYGLPCFTYDTGGVGNYVRNGINGYRLPLGCNGKDFALKIISCIKNNEFPQLSRGGKRLYAECLNWNVYIRKLQSALRG